MILVDLIAGARPNFMKIAPIVAAIDQAKTKGKAIDYRLVHTGQHYDQKMSQSFFDQLGIPAPHINLESGSGSQATQTAAIMTRYEQLLIDQPCDICLVVGDVTSTMACAITAKKMLIQVAHVEAGIRSGDRTMPEEINRLVTDSITDYFFTTTEEASENLIQSGTQPKHIFWVGNTMIDTLLKQLPLLKAPEPLWGENKLSPKKYIVITLHRPSNVDSPLQLKAIMDEIQLSAKGTPLVFPVHPRTRKMLQGMTYPATGWILCEPLGYQEFNYLVKNSLGVITDSGGITEETTVLGIPCMTLRSSTERPETCNTGTNVLLGDNPKAIQPAMQQLLSGNWKKGAIPEKWDGNAAERIVDCLLKLDYKISL